MLTKIVRTVVFFKMFIILTLAYCIYFQFSFLYLEYNLAENSRLKGPWTMSSVLT